MKIYRGLFNFVEVISFINQLLQINLFTIACHSRIKVRLVFIIKVNKTQILWHQAHFIKAAVLQVHGFIRSEIGKHISFKFMKIVLPRLAST